MPRGAVWKTAFPAGRKVLTLPTPPHCFTFPANTSLTKPLNKIQMNNRCLSWACPRKGGSDIALSIWRRALRNPKIFVFGIQNPDSFLRQAQDRLLRPSKWKKISNLSSWAAAKDLGVSWLPYFCKGLLWRDLYKDLIVKRARGGLLPSILRGEELNIWITQIEGTGLLFWGSIAEPVLSLPKERKCVLFTSGGSQPRVTLAGQVSKLYHWKNFGSFYSIAYSCFFAPFFQRLLSVLLREWWAATAL